MRIGEVEEGLITARNEYGVVMGLGAEESDVVAVVAVMPVTATTGDEQGRRNFKLLRNFPRLRGPEPMPRMSHSILACLKTQIATDETRM